VSHQLTRARAANSIAPQPYLCFAGVAVLITKRRIALLFLFAVCVCGFSSFAFAQQADLSLSKTVSNATPNVGDPITFTLTLTNNGPDLGTGVQVNDLLPAGLTFVSATPSQGTYDPVIGLWAVGTIPTGASQTLSIVATVVSPSPQTNTATISNADQFDPNTANNSAGATETPVQAADLAVSKTVSNATPNVGDPITFTLTLTNNGPILGTGVQVNDLLPAGLAFVAATPSQGTYDSLIGLWTVGTISTGTSQTLSIVAAVVGPSPQTNTATISNADQFDPNTANNSASATETPAQADLAVSKTVSNATPNVGNQITFTLTLTNNGPDPGTGVQVNDLLPAGLTFVAATPSQGTYDPAIGLWAVGTVSTGTSQTLSIVATVVGPSPQTNTATISNADQFDPNTANNSASATETPAPAQGADLAVSKTVSKPTPNVGDQITFTITLTNNGPNPGTGVQLADVLPAGLTFVSATPSQGTYTPGTGLWVVGAISTGTPQTLSIVATVISPSPQTNTATVSKADQFDPNTANNSASATVTPPRADIVLTIVASTPTAVTGTTLTWTVTATNNGPDPATNVAVTDLVPAGATFVSATPSQGTYSSGTGLWSVGTLGSASLALTVIAGAPATITDTASVSHSDQFDPNTANNSASSTVTILVPLPPAVIPTLSDWLLAALALLLAALAVRGLRRRSR